MEIEVVELEEDAGRCLGSKGIGVDGQGTKRFTV